jgi:hypothetical protein
MGSQDESFFMRMKSINAKKGLLIPLKHNLREDQKERGSRRHIDPGRLGLNYQLEGIADAKQTTEWAEALISESGAKVRANASLAVEIIFSLPADRHGTDTRPYFEDCLKWLRNEFKGLEVLSFAVHLDEAAPHAHAILLSLKEGRICGSEIMGNRVAAMRRQDDFFWKVANKHGLKKPARKLSVKENEQLFNVVSSAIHSEGFIPKSKIHSLLMDEIRKAPVKYAQAMGVSLPDRVSGGGKSFVAIMTKPVRGP